jgi:hypothetical protein
MQQTTRPASSFLTQLKSADDKFLIQLSITPNHLGINKFVVNVRDAHSASSELPMDGNWDIHVQLLDGGIHIAKVKVYTPT